MICVDASALVAIVTAEPEAARLLAALGADPARFTIPLAVYEATLGICRKTRSTVEEARRDVMDLLADAGIRLLPTTAAEADLALTAFARYGKGQGQGHPARLNMGDCFAYAATRHHGARLLCKGDDFPHTDLPLALPPARI